MDWNDVLTLANTSETIAVYGIAAYLFLSRAIGAWRQRRHRADSGSFTVHPEQPVQAESGVESVTTMNAEDTTWIGFGEREPE